MLSVVNKTRGTILARRVRVAVSWRERLVGLLGSDSLASGDGLWISPCQAVHTFFMRYAIDALFLDDKNTAIGLATLAPWRLSSWKPRSRGVLELRAGTLAETRTQLGDDIEMRAE